MVNISNSNEPTCRWGQRDRGAIFDLEIREFNQVGSELTYISPFYSSVGHQKFIGNWREHFKAPHSVVHAAAERCRRRFFATPPPPKKTNGVIRRELYFLKSLLRQKKLEFYHKRYKVR